MKRPRQLSAVERKSTNRAFVPAGATVNTASLAKSFMTI